MKLFERETSERKLMQVPCEQLHLQIETHLICLAFNTWEPSFHWKFERGDFMQFPAIQITLKRGQVPTYLPLSETV